jgi:rhodanese-related sulfurtransferase
MEVVIKELDAPSLKKGLESGEIAAIDVREPLEYHEEHISRAQLFPLSQFDARQLPDPAGKRLVFYCQMGRRSHIAAAKWGTLMGATEVQCLKGGLNSWKKEGLTTVVDSNTSAKIERQTYLLSGLMILLALLFAGIVSDWFLLFPGAIAVLLVISGIVGHSYLSFLLSKLPWNR